MKRRRFLAALLAIPAALFAAKPQQAPAQPKRQTWQEGGRIFTLDERGVLHVHVFQP